MRVERLPTADSAIQRAAEVIVDLVSDAVASRGQASLALSGGRTAVVLAEQLARADPPWTAVQVFQVDERLVAADDADRNWPRLSSLVDRMPLGQAHPMPVEDEDGALAYQAELTGTLGATPVLDVVQLGVGADGHTASLPPGDPVLDVVDREVALSGEYAGHRRMTLTIPMVRRARSVVLLAVGREKAEAAARLVAGDPSSVAARVVGPTSVLVVDEAAAQRLSVSPSDSNR
jgi:6-phosphogluconolactonase